MMQSTDQVFDQFRVNYGEGVTPTERFLNSLGERSFLRFWSHANPHVSQSQELCDLLVICGDYVIVFSDKSIDYQLDNDEQVAWQRWYKRAIAKSASQLHGAVRHLVRLKSPVYKDPSCTVPLGIPVPSPEKARVYRVAVVSRSKEVDDAHHHSPSWR